MHDRVWQGNRYVYPVVSRRSKGISIGVNLNRTRRATLTASIVSVDRSCRRCRGRGGCGFGVAREELGGCWVGAVGGDLSFDPFANSSGAAAGEWGWFLGRWRADDVPGVWAGGRNGGESCGRMPRNPPVKLVVITNATMFHRPAVREALAFLDKITGNLGEVRRGDDGADYKLVDRSRVPFDGCWKCPLVCRMRPTVIQTLLMRVKGEGGTGAEIATCVCGAAAGGGAQEEG